MEWWPVRHPPGDRRRPKCARRTVEPDKRRRRAARRADAPVARSRTRDAVRAWPWRRSAAAWQAASCYYSAPWPVYFVMRLHVTRSLAAIAAIAIVSGCAARAADSDIPTMRQAHMQMTLHQPQRPGDRARANAIVAAARKVMAEYPTVQAAEDAGFTKFLPRIPLPIEHYTKREY